MSLFRLQRAPKRRGVVRTSRLSLETLEGRQMLSVFTVVNTLNDGPGSLRRAILDANGQSGPNTIAFQIGGGGVQTIQLTSSLPVITEPVVLDGTTQPGFAGIPLIQLAGGPRARAGLRITAGNSTVRGLALHDFASVGIDLDGEAGDQVVGNYIGLGGPGARVGISAGAGRNTIGGTAAGDRNVISGNDIGVRCGNGTVVLGNYIGTDISGTAALPNTVAILARGMNVTIGGTNAGAGNLISGNRMQGIRLDGGGNAVIQGNFIGTDITGTRVLANRGDGIEIVDGTNDTIGGTALGAHNVISGNDAGISLGGSGHLVQGNFIGTDAAGTQGLRNETGVLVLGNGNTIGGTTPGAGNLISGNAVGISISNGAGNVVAGNFIGTDVAGTQYLGANFGVRLDGAGATNNVIGGTTVGARNLIVGNQDEVEISGDAAFNSVQGNYIGTDVTGTRSLNAGGVGVVIDGPAHDNLIGGASAGAGNLISGNFIGVGIGAATANRLQGNRIGTDASGTTALGNSFSGVLFAAGAVGNLIGGTAAGAGNVISGNFSGDLELMPGSSNNLVQGNFVGTDITGTHALGNGLFGGIEISPGSTNNTIGGIEPGAGNLISGNRQGGVYIAGTATLVQGNRIGTDVTGTRALGNYLGVDVIAADATIGGIEPGAGNLISGNQNDGISIYGTAATGIVVQGNRIGTDISGTQALGNNGNGINITGGASNDTVSHNRIGFNGRDGVLVNGGTSDAILRNAILGHDNGLGIELANGGNNDQEFPQLTSATTDGSTTTVEGMLTSTPATTFRVELFVNAVCNPSGYGEGEQFLGALTVTTDADGNAAFAFTAPIGADPGQFIATTATDPDGNTSAFSACIEVTAADSAKQIAATSLRFPVYYPAATPEPHAPVVIALAFPFPDDGKPTGRGPSSSGDRLAAGDAPTPLPRSHRVPPGRSRPRHGPGALDNPFLIGWEI